MKTNVEKFQEVCADLTKLYEEKNRRYNDSFARQFKKTGLAMTSMRLEDKFNRFQALVENPQDDGGDETIVDTLKDLANYSIMTIMALNEGVE